MKIIIVILLIGLIIVAGCSQGMPPPIQSDDRDMIENNWTKTEEDNLDQALQDLETVDSS